MTDATITERPEAQLLSAAEAAGLQLSMLLDAVPEADENAYVGILTQIVNAQSADQVDAPWEAGSLKQYAGQWMTLRSVKKMPSDFTEGLGFYVIIEAQLQDSGEIVTCSTGSVAIVTQLAKLVQLDALPRLVRPVNARKASRNGYVAMHLEVAKS